MSDSLNSALYWFPRIEHLGVPDTQFVPYSHAGWVHVMEGGNGWASAGLGGALELITATATMMGFPLFVRSDQTSAKHSGPTAYRADNPDTLRRALFATVEDNEIKLWLDPEQPQAFMLREFIDLHAAFTAFDGHPIANEWRYFVRHGEIACAHFYWPTDAIKFFGNPEPPRWRSQLRTLRTDRPGWDVTLRAKKAGAACNDHEFWSVDFAQGRDDKWWLIDMATGERSWHPKCAVPSTGEAS